MKKLIELTKVHNLHPLDVIMLAANYGNLEDVYPIVHDGLFNTVLQLAGLREWAADDEAGEAEADTAAVRVVIGYSEIQLKVIRKLYRKDKWGNVGVQMTTVLKHMAGVGGKEGRDEVDELARKGILLVDGGGSENCSLNPKRRKDIEAIVATMEQG